MKYWATNYGREKTKGDFAKAGNKIERVVEIIKAVSENEGKDIGLYYRDRLDFEAERDRKERSGELETILIDRDKALEMAERAAGRKIDDLQIISTKDPNIKEIVGADAIAGRAYHVGNGKIVIVADNIGDYAKAMGTIAEEGRHIYHRNNNGLEDSEDYASFYGRQFERYYDRNFGDNDVAFITERLKYTKEQLGNDWENDIWIVHHPQGVNHASIYDDVSGLIYSYGEPVPYVEEIYKQKKLKRKGSLGKAENDVLQVSTLNGYLKSYKSKKVDVAMYKLNLTEKDRKKVENNLKNSIKGLEEFKCIGENCSKEGIKTAREGGKYYFTPNNRYGLLMNNCTVFVERQFIGTSKEAELSSIGILPSNLRDYAIDNNRATTLVYYNYSGNGNKITFDLKNKSPKKIKKELKYLEEN